MHGPLHEPYAGLSYHEYFVERERLWKLEHKQEEDEDEDAGVPVVTTSMRDATDEEVDGCAITSARNLAEAAGFETRLGYAQATIRGTVFKSGEHTGERRPDAVVETLTLIGRYRGRGSFRVSYNRSNGGKWVRYFGQINGELRSVSNKELREWIKNSQ